MTQRPPIAVPPEQWATLVTLGERLGYRFETSADGREARVFRPDGSLALRATRPGETTSCPECAALRS